MDITNINHVGMIARDLEDVTRRYEAMGFMLTPYSPHSAAWKPGEGASQDVVYEAGEARGPAALRVGRP